MKHINQTNEAEIGLIKIKNNSDQFLAPVLWPDTSEIYETTSSDERETEEILSQYNFI